MNANKKDELPIVLQMSEVQKILGLSKTKIYELARQKDFPVLEIGCRKVVYRDDFFKWLDTKRRS